MPIPSINLGINSQGKKLIFSIENHFKLHEPNLHKGLILSSSLERLDDNLCLSIINEGKFIESTKDSIKEWFDFEQYGAIKTLTQEVNDVRLDTVIINIVIPIAEDGSIKLLKEFLDSISQLQDGQRISGLDIKLFTIVYPLEEQSHSFDSTIKEQLRSLQDISNEYDNIIKDIYYFDDRNISQVALNLDLNWLGFALGEFFIFQMVEPTSLAIQEKNKVFGLGVIHFNEVLFRNVISNKILQYKFEEEGVLESDGIQLKDITDKCNPFIKEHQNFLMTFLKEFPFSEKNNKELTNNSKHYIKEFKLSLDSFITNKENNIGESKVLLANLFGEDDEILEGINWKVERLTINDLEFDVINFFNKYLDEDDKVDYINQKRLREKITELNQVIKKDKKTIEKIISKSEIINADLDISLEKGIFSVGEKRINVSGYKPSRINPNDETYKFNNDGIPIKVDLSDYFSSVKDQGQLGSCTAFPVSAVYEYSAMLNNNPVEISELFIYYNTRELKGNVEVDSGASILDTINSVKDNGACYEPNYPYNIDNFKEKPSEESYIEGKHQVVEKALRVSIVEEDFKHAIANGYPVIIGLKLYKSFYPKDNSGIIPYPLANEASHENHGNHALLIVGYNEEEKLFKLRNSWGTDFGDNGYCYAPFDYIDNTTFCSEAFIITDIVDLSYEEFTYDSGADFSFLKDTLLRKKNIVEFNLREKNNEISKIKKEHDIIALQNEENALQIKDPIFRKQLLNNIRELDRRIVPNNMLISDNINNDNLVNNKSDKDIYWYIGGGVILMISIATYFFQPIKPIIAIVVGIIGLATILWRILKDKTTTHLPPPTPPSPPIDRITYSEEDIYTFMVADRLFDEFENMGNDLLIRYNALSKFFKNVKEWQKENLEEFDEIEYDSPTFVKNVIEVAPLINYLEHEKDIFLKGLPNLSNVFHEKFFPKKKNEEEVFQELKSTYLDAIRQEIDKVIDISMVDYLLGNKEYPFFNKVPDLSSIIKSLESVSLPFCNIKASSSSMDIQSFVVKEKIIKNKDEAEMKFSRHMNASIKPVLISRISNKKKYVSVQISALKDINSLVKY